ncbi:M23 family metallopeptidase [Evansella halocellulosilytica]|uniref:M23 family metallopeptidase n=1 Tax=Evansella halocellulosilytica TaxID=2011013 RepID=UPI0015C76E5F|nr:M23 family metallopeptidase [Evansella halocellulosilytica]
MISVKVQPEQVFVVKGRSQQTIHCDFIFKNMCDRNYQLSAIRMMAFDQSDYVISHKLINGNGLAPSITTFPQRVAIPDGSIHIFNPFHSFDLELNISYLDFVFTFATENGDELYAHATIRPVEYKTKTDLILPLKVRTYVSDGDDYYSHHRRVDFTHPVAQKLSLQKNPQRYAYDFSVIDDQGNLFHNNRNLENWYGYGTTVFSPGSGIVAEVVNDIPDNWFEDHQVVMGKNLNMTDLSSFAGNYVLIDHENGEFSMLAHFKQGSIIVSKEDRIAQGEEIGKIGFSGDTSDWVHLHYELRNDMSFVESEGLPISFKNFNRYIGGKSVHHKFGKIETGDIITE